MAGSMPDARVGRAAALKEGSRVTTPEPSVPAAPDAAGTPPRRIVDENPPTDPIPVLTEEVMAHVEASSPELSPTPPEHNVPEVPVPRHEPSDPPVDVSSPASESWSDSINASMVVASPRRRPRAPVAAIGAGVAALLVVVAAVAWWILTPGDTETSTVPETTSPSATPNPDDQLLKRLNAIFPSGACRSTPSADTVEATCTTTDPNWPPSATYTLARDRAAMAQEFDAITRSLDVQICPGRIQSPGPWRRLATPDRVAGTVVCGMQAGVSTVAWTTDGDLLVSTIHGGNPVPTLDQLYDWWTRHS
ncbi:hypothetical protein JF737_15880 [Mycobacterium avium]|uniref:hypothetical protein n=1 Tax=Mycobacterium avium TaxID=1764 RepID=UPI001CDA6B53|nr:hypothetical protein [Mycobacterium avium]MCA2238129.1 hypothetical protein [Mycobacterium avium]MCA2259148.1 hypothetical protein [Mycobacterium avium]MCA2270062.1 hypothetical protein [Mycobacterium avium]MCA2280053.1 hypothetical protein [Mycobacterium avium]MCA2290044.1 hypothetical protein [Mycobacterium avium]